MTVVDQDVVRLDVSVNHLALAKVTEGCQQLPSEELHCWHGQPLVATKLPSQVPQVHLHGFKHKAHVAPVLKVTEEPHAVLVVVWVCIAWEEREGEMKGQG